MGIKTVFEQSATVLHIGPDRRDLGGMGRVIDNLVQHSGGSAASVSTWRPGSPWGSAVATMRLLVRLARRRRGYSQPIIHAHLSEGGSWIREGAVVIGAHLLGYRTVITLHGADFPQWVQRGLNARIARVVMQCCGAVCVLTQQTRVICERLAMADRIHQVFNPVPEPKSHQATPSTPTGPVVIFVGEISRRKGVDVLCQAWPLVLESAPAARLILVGPPSDYDLPSLPHMIYEGPQARDFVERAIAQSDLLVLPSRAEAQPMVILEAMSQSKPFVASDVGAVSLLADGQRGVLVPSENPAHLASALTELLRDEDRRQSMGIAGRAWYREHAAPSAVHRSLESIYRGIPS